MWLALFSELLQSSSTLATASLCYISWSACKPPNAAWHHGMQRRATRRRDKYLCKEEQQEGSINIYRSWVYQRFKKSSQNARVYLEFKGKTEKAQLRGFLLIRIQI